MKVHIRTFLVLAFLVTSGMPLAVFWLWPHSAALQSQVDEAHGRHLLIAENLSTTLQVYHRDLVTAFEAFAPQISQGAAVEASAIFENLYFRHICVISPETGQVIREYFSEIHACPKYVPEARLQHFRELVPDEGVGISDVTAVKGELPRLFLVTRENGTMVVGAIHTTFFKNLQMGINFGEGGHAVIVDGNGHVLAHPIGDWSDQALDLSSVSAVQQIMAGERGVTRFFSPTMHTEMIAGYAAAEGTNWGVMVPQPIEELVAFAENINRNALFVLLAGLAFSWIVALMISATISRRVHCIERAVLNLAEGIEPPSTSFGNRFWGVTEFSNLKEGVTRAATEIRNAKSETESKSAHLVEANEKLRQEIHEKINAKSALSVSEMRFKSLFESQPISVREEDHSEIKKVLDALPVNNTTELLAYFDAHPDFIAECVSLAVVRDANEKALELHGYHDKSAFKHSVTRNLSQSSIDVLKKVFVAIYSGEPLLEFETKILRKDGDERTVMARWSVISGCEETYERVILTSIDITDHLKAEERLRQAQKMEAVGQLTGGVAHDINNLLAVIRGNAELLLKEDTFDLELTEPIINAVERGAELTRGLLAFSRKQTLNPTTIELGGLVLGMTDILRRTLGATIELNTQIAPTLWQATADAGQVENALLNLCLNARDAMPQGGALTIECKNTHFVSPPDKEDADSLPGEYVMMAVTDYGTGMDPEALSHAFEPFYTTKEVGKGTGLGLAMVYGFAKQSGGHITIQSELGEWTRVCLYLPRAVKKTQSQEGNRSTEDAPIGSGEMILVVEDDPEVRLLTVRLLNSLNYKTIDVERASLAKDILLSGQEIDLILSDVILPGGVSGPEFAKQIAPDFPMLKFVFMSGYPADENLESDGQIFRDVLLSKPFKRQELAKAIHDQLNK